MRQANRLNSSQLCYAAKKAIFITRIVFSSKPNFRNMQHKLWQLPFVLFACIAVTYTV